MRRVQATIRRCSSCRPIIYREVMRTRKLGPLEVKIAGATKPEQVRANAAAGAWEPTPDELQELLAGV